MRRSVDNIAYCVNMLHLLATSILGRAATVAALLLLYSTLLVPARCTVLRENITDLASAANLSCSDPATNLCIRKLICDELIPLQDFVANGSNLLNAADQLFVERVWAYVQVSAKDPITATISEITDIERTLSYSHVTWNLIRQKVNAMTMNLTQSQDYLEGGVELLEEVMVVLQQQIKLKITSAIILSIQSEELLTTAQEILEDVSRLKSELNLSLCQVSNSASHISNSSQDINNITAISSATNILRNQVELLTLENNTHQQVRDIEKKISMLTGGIKEVGLVLKEINTVFEVGKLIQTRAKKTEMDILQEVFEFEELSTSVENLVSDTEGVVHNASAIITTVLQLLQNVSYMVNVSTHILVGHQMFRERLPLLQIGADAAIQHALEIFHQVQSITLVGTKFLNDEFTDEFDQLSIINTTASEAIMIVHSSLLIKTSNVDKLLNFTEVIITRAGLLQQSATNITSPSLSVLVHQLDKGLTQYDVVHSTYLNIVQGLDLFEQIQSTISEVILDHIAHLDLIQSSVDTANETRNVVLSMLESINATDIKTGIYQITTNSLDILNQTTSNFSDVTINQHSLEGELQNLSLSFQQLADTQSSLNDMLNRASSIVSHTYTIIDQVDLPLEFSGDQVLTIPLGLEDSTDPLISGEFRSLSLQFTAVNISDSIIIHLISSRGNQARTELLVELFDSKLKVVLKDVNARGQEFPLSITVSGSTLETNRTYLVYISRTELNVHVELTDLQSSEVFTVNKLASNRLRRAFSASSFLASTTLYIGGNSPLNKDRSNFSGCLSNLHINGGHLNVWSLAVGTGEMNLHVCSMNHLLTGDDGKIQLLLDESQFAQQWVNGSFLPVVIELQTQLPSGLILYTHSRSSEPVLNTFSVYLELGKIEVRVVAGDAQRTLTSSQTYHNGALHTIKIDLEGSRLALRTKKEVVTKRLQEATISSLSTYSELLVGGVGVRVREEEEVDQSNFTGCVSVLSTSSVVKVPKCFEQEIIECVYCSPHETVFFAEFYGTSYVQFPTFIADEYLDITLNFRTYFANGLVFFIGNAAQNMWLALALNDGSLNMLFQAGANTPLGISEGTDLDDGSIHTVTIIRSGSSLSITVDEETIVSPFGSSVPSGTFASDLFIGGIARSHTNLLYAGALWDGFKGCLDSIRVNGRIFDYSENLASEETTFVVEDKISSTQNGQDFYFNGITSFAEFDIGRFPENFSLGFQFNAASEDGLLFYVFSRRREDKMAIQLNHTTLQLYTLESISGFERTVSLSQETTLRQWHDVKIIQEGNRISITLNGNLALQESLTLPNPLRTTSPLYIGGLPSDQRIPLSSSVVTEHFMGCLRTHYLSLATIKHEIELNSCQGTS